MIELLQSVFIWWFVFFLLGLLATPFTIRLFAGFFDKGYIFSKIIGLISVSYCMYVLATVRILPFNTVSLGVIFIVIAAISSLYAMKGKVLGEIKNNWKIFLFEEGFFLLGLLLWSYVKSFQPDIHGLEKFMDYGFINSILRSTYFPPKDMWMAPLTINYYYFGHLMTATATKMSFLPSAITFNLMLATIFSLTFTQFFSLGANLIFFLKRQAKSHVHMYQLILIGLVTAILLTFGGNLHTLYTFFTPYQNDSPVAPTQLTFSPQTFPNQYWYPNATRFIYHTIHEFPMYSFVVSDLHGHVLDIPAVILMIGLLFVVFLDPVQKGASFFLKVILLGSLSSILYMTNAWDGLIYIGVSLCVVSIKSFSKNIFTTLFSKSLFISVILLIGSFILVGLPFSLFFKPFASAIGINCAPQFLLNLRQIGPLLFEEGYCQYSPLWQLAILYGFFLFWLTSLITLLIVIKKRGHKIYSVDFFVLGLSILGLVLIVLPEFVYLKDIYTTYFRANTMFKLVYQAFMLLSLVNGYAIYRIFSSIRGSKKSLVQRLFILPYFLIASILITLVLIYPYFAITSYFNNLKNFTGLNGLTYLQTISKDDYAAVNWINKNISGQPILLEAQGDSYTDYERISSNTGLPTVFGWMVHEWLWRGTYDIVPERIADIKAIYESKSITETKDLLRKYSVQYVYIGDMERTKYPGIDEEKFNQLGKIVYSTGNVKIYNLH